MSDHKKHMASLRRSMYRSDSSQLDLGAGRRASSTTPSRASPDRPARKASGSASAGGGGILKAVNRSVSAPGASDGTGDGALSDPEDLL